MPSPATPRIRPNPWARPIAVVALATAMLTLFFCTRVDAVLVGPLSPAAAMTTTNFSAE